MTGFCFLFAFQKIKFNKHWQGFEISLIETEIQENRQWKIVIDETIACIFAVTYEDELIWGEKNNDSAIYIHRIVTNPAFRGNNHVNIIVEWAKEFCKNNNKQFIRMDTWGDNPKLIDYYVKCGFNYLETVDLDNTEGLPSHYKGSLALFEIKI